MLASLALALTLAARPLSQPELQAVASLLEGHRPIAGQAFETDALGPGEPRWFVPAVRQGHLLGLLTGRDHRRLGALELEPGARLESLEAVSFPDLDGDGRSELVLIARVASGEGPARRQALIWRAGPAGLEEDRATEQRAREALGEQVTVAALRKLRPPQPATQQARLAASCQAMRLPLALSAQGALAYSDPGGLVELGTLSAPAWLTPRLQEAVGRATGLGCERIDDEHAIHHMRIACGDPVRGLNDALAARPRPPEFAFYREALDPDLASLEQGQVALRRAAGGLEAGRAALPPGCAAHARVLGALATEGAVYVFAVGAGVEVPEQLYVMPDDEDTRSCYESGGTCVHDIVEVPAAFPGVTLIRLTSR